jgi:hypothetical protein
MNKHSNNECKTGHNTRRALVGGGGYMKRVNRMNMGDVLYTNMNR